MKAETLAKKLLEFPDFDVIFTVMVEKGSGRGLSSTRTFNDIDIGDIGYSSKIIDLHGTEEK